MKPSWMRFPPSLRASIPLLVLASGLLYLLVTAWLLTQRDLARTKEGVIGIASQQAARLASMMVGTAGLNEGTAERDIAFLATDVRVHWVAMCTPGGTITSSSRPEWKERRLSAVTSPAVSTAVQKAAAEGTLQVVVLQEESVVAVHPVFQVPGKSAVQLLTLVERELAASLMIQRENARQDTIFAAGLLLVSCLLLWAALHGFLTRRVRLLLESSQLLKTGTPLKKPIGGSDEFARIFDALKESEDRFRQLADNIRDVFYMVSADRSRILYVSPAYEEVWGHPVASVMESPDSWLQTVEEPDREDVMRQHDPLSRGASSVRMEYRIRRPDGTTRWIENRAFPVLDENGRLYRIAGLARDVTDRKHLEKELLNATEHERRRIGRDLHDDLCQRLAAIKIKCELFTEGIKRGEPPDGVRATEMCAFIGEASALCRGVARSLVPVDLAGEGLMVALDKLVETVEALNEVPCFFYCPDSVMVESTSAAVHLYRITQEFLNNAIRHGRPTRVDVRLEMSADFVRIEVVNDGQPYADPSPSNHGMGLKILHFRADAIGATMRIQPRSDGIPGTIATCLAPHSACNPDPPSKS